MTYCGRWTYKDEVAAEKGAAAAEDAGATTRDRSGQSVGSVTSSSPVLR